MKDESDFDKQGDVPMGRSEWLLVLIILGVCVLAAWKVLEVVGRLWS